MGILPVPERLVTFCLLLGVTQGLAAERPPKAVTPLPQAHAHNDYEHPRPLYDALDHGYCSVEADIFLVDGKLLVAHERSRLQPNRSLESLYLNPLRKRIEANGGAVYPGGPALSLLIDIKSDGPATYRALHELLRSYADILTSVKDGQVRPGPVLAIISGNCPRELIRSQATRYAGIDGRLSDLTANDPPHLMPLISDRWSKHFRWRGEGRMPEAERQRLEEIVTQVHRSGRRLRFWATPHNEPMARALLAAKVDLIGSDNLPWLQCVLLDQEPPSPR